MTHMLNFDDIQEGDRWESRGRTVTETDVINFAGVSGDYDPLHVDHQFAKESPFGRPVAHGLLGLALCAGLSSTAPAMQTAAFLGIREWEFRKPIFIGDTIRAVTIVEQMEASSRRHGRVVWRRQVLNQHDEIVQEGLFETLVAVASQSKRDTSSATQPSHSHQPHLHMRRAVSDPEVSTRNPPT